MNKTRRGFRRRGAVFTSVKAVNKAISAYLRGEKIINIARSMGCSREAITYRLQQAGVKFYPVSKRLNKKDGLSYSQRYWKTITLERKAMLAKASRKYRKNNWLKCKETDIRCKRNRTVKQKVWSRVNGSAKKKKLYLCDRVDFYNWWTSSADICFYCKISPKEMQNRSIPRRFGKGERLGVDRADNSKGYDFDNMRKCCPVCNFVKSNIFDETAMLQIGTAIKGWYDRSNKT